MKNKKNFILHLISLGILCAGYVLTRYVFFDLHGMKAWPLVLFVCGIVVVGISFIEKGKQVPIFTALSYCNQRIQTDGFAEQNGRDAERAD